MVVGDSSDMGANIIRNHLVFDFVDGSKGSRINTLSFSKFFMFSGVIRRFSPSENKFINKINNVILVIIFQTIPSGIKMNSLS